MRTAVVTGAASGMGRATADLLLADIKRQLPKLEQGSLSTGEADSGAFHH